MMVKEDLERLGLVTLKEKCQWEPVQKFVWCRFLWDLNEFRVLVTEEKKDSIKAMATELLGKSLEAAAFTGLVITCTPAVGRSAMFYTRFYVAW